MHKHYATEVKASSSQVTLLFSLLPSFSHQKWLNPRRSAVRMYRAARLRARFALASTRRNQQCCIERQQYPKNLRSRNNQAMPVCVATKHRAFRHTASTPRPPP
jgi:hypothetical protein